MEEDFATGKSIIARENLVTTNKNRSSKVTTLLLGTTDKQLAMLKERKDTKTVDFEITTEKIPEWYSKIKI